MVVCSVASALLLILSWPAFKYFFFAEAFTYLRIYDLNGRNLWQAAFSRMDGMFFRPGFFLSDIWWHFVLPPDPLLYHARNFIFCAINLFLFYRVLLKFVQSRQARIIALGLLAASKIYLTIIGYVNVYEASILLMTILLAVLFWFRYIEGRRPADYLLTLLFCTFSAYSKDNGFIVIGVLGAMLLALAIKPGEGKREALYWAVRFAPFVVVSASYLALRYALTGPLNLTNPVYSPRLSLAVALWQTKAFLATVGNFSLTDPGFMGERGLSSVLAGNSRAVEFALCAALWLLILFTLWRGRSAWRLLIVPLVWVGLYLSPTFLIRNHQVYYHQEPLAGVALLVGICLDRAKRPLLTAWAVVVALIAINGFISNRRSYYTWEYCANRAEVVKPIVAAQKNDPPKSIVFVTSPESSGFWTFDLGGAFVPHLLGSPDTRVYVVSSTATVDPEAQVYHLPD
jgi:uncharacterized membrane protein YqhA